MEKSLSLTDFQGSLSPIDSSSAWKKKRNKSFGTLLTLDDLSHLPFERHQSTPASFAHDEGIGNSDASFDQLSLLSQFELRLGIEVEDTLRRASEHVGGDRAASLEDLYHNVCIRIEDSVRARLQQSEPEREIPEYYFQLLANFFADNPYGSAMVSHFHRYWMSLWSHEIFPAVFSLLFGKWLFQNLPTASTPLASHVIVYISGVNRVLWNDVQSDRRMFRTVYNQLSEVVKSLELQLRLPPRLRLDLQNLCFRFYFHYEDPANIRAFLQSLPDVADPATYGLKNGGHGWGSRHDSVDSADGNSSVTSFDSEAEEPKLSDVMEGELVDTPRSEPPNLTALASITQPIGGVVHSRETNPKRTRLLRRTSHARAQTIALDENANPKTLVRSQSESAKTEIPRKPSGLSDTGDADGSAETHAALARAANEFVCEVMTTLRNISKESSLLRYLRNILHLSGLPLSASTASRLQAALYKYITPGGPLYPTRRVRHTARQVMDELFPVRCRSGVLIMCFTMFICTGREVCPHSCEHNFPVNPPFPMAAVLVVLVFNHCACTCGVSCGINPSNGVTVPHLCQHCSLDDELLGMPSGGGSCGRVLQCSRWKFKRPPGAHCSAQAGANCQYSSHGAGACNIELGQLRPPNPSHGVCPGQFAKDFLVISKLRWPEAFLTH